LALRPALLRTSRPLLRSCLCRPLIFASRPRQFVRYTIVSFVTGVFKYRPPRLPQGKTCGPGSRPRFLIFNCEFVVDSVGVEAREPFGHSHVLTRILERVLPVKVCCLDN